MPPSSGVALHHGAQTLLYHAVKRGHRKVYKLFHFRVSVEICEFLLHIFKFGKLNIERGKSEGNYK